VAEKYKSVLEKHNESKTHRVPTAEEEAIKPVYPEEYLVGGPGKAVASSFMGSGKKAAKSIPRNTKIGSKVPEPWVQAADEAVRDRFYKSKPGQATYEALKKRAERVAKAETMNEIKSTARRSGERSSTNFFGEAGALIGGEMADQNRNAAGDTYKKGGLTASSRADGCAVKGKTKGRMM